MFGEVNVDEFWIYIAAMVVVVVEVGVLVRGGWKGGHFDGTIVDSCGSGGRRWGPAAWQGRLDDISWLVIGKTRGGNCYSTEPLQH